MKKINESGLKVLWKRSTFDIYFASEEVNSQQEKGIDYPTHLKIVHINTDKKRHQHNILPCTHIFKTTFSMTNKKSLISTFFLFLISLMTNFLFAQPENYTVAINDFQKHYNDENYVEIFNSFAADMQEALPLEKTQETFSALSKSYGKIESRQVIDTDSEAGVIYKVKFERITLKITIKLDEENKFIRLLIKPYEEEPGDLNKTVNALTYPTEIAEAIFSKTYDFPNNTQLSIAVIENDETKYYGIIKENDTLKTIENQDKVFEIGSITKVFTSTLLSTLVTNKKLKLSDNINTYYPFIFKNDIQLSFESLANHTSGLPRLPDNFDLSNTSNPYQMYGKSEIEDYLKNYLLLNDNLNTYSYSNLGAGLLGYTLGLSQKTSFQDLLQNEIFDKYGMKNSYTNSINISNNLVEGLDVNGNVVSNWDFDALSGGGAILSTTEDLAKFAIAQFDPKNEELVLTRIPTFTVNEEMKIGLGWHILKSKDDTDLFWHNGGTGGYSSSMAIDMDNKFAVIILSNVSAFNPRMKNIDKLCFELCER